MDKKLNAEELKDINGGYFCEDEESKKLLKKVMNKINSMTDQQEKYNWAMKVNWLNGNGVKGDADKIREIFGDLLK